MIIYSESTQCLVVIAEQDLSLMNLGNKKHLLYKSILSIHKYLSRYTINNAHMLQNAVLFCFSLLPLCWLQNASKLEIKFHQGIMLQASQKIV
jgi:hypothetical protein